MAADEQGRELSDDGNYYWDGSAWQLVDRGTASSGDSPSSPQASEDEVRAVGDTSSGPAQNVPEHLQYVFEDKDPQGGAGNEIAALLDDSTFTGPA